AQEEGTERVCRRPNRVPIRFETVRLVLSATRTEESLEMLKKAGLAEYVEPKSVTAKATYIDLEHISSTMRVHK
ncbi:unnamed protein product, partial [Polarella glacialis]